jgi:hypothetical protein
MVLPPVRHDRHGAGRDRSGTPRRRREHVPERPALVGADDDEQGRAVTRRDKDFRRATPGRHRLYVPRELGECPIQRLAHQPARLPLQLFALDPGLGAVRFPGVHDVKMRSPEAELPGLPTEGPPLTHQNCRPPPRREDDRRTAVSGRA